MEQTEPEFEQSLHLQNQLESELKLVKDTSMTNEEMDNELTLDTICDEGVAWNDCLPPEIVILIFKYLDCKSLTKVAMTNSYWYDLFNSKDIQRCFKNECFDIFDRKGIYSATKQYLLQFNDWKNMFIYRPRVRSDGVYFSKVGYWHDGITDFGDHHPTHKITYYIFLAFNSYGQVFHTSTVLEPEVFLEKLKRKKISVEAGSYYIKNRTIYVEVPKGADVFCHRYLMHGEMNSISDSFTLKEKTLLNPVTQFFQILRLKHSKADFEFYNCKVNSYLNF